MKSAGFDKASLSNVLLLGFFALGLGLAFIMVHLRSTIVLSEPIELPGEGLSVTVPVGSGWESLTNWTYERDNSFTLVSVLRDRGLAEVRWQLRLAEKASSSEDLLRRYAARFAGQAGEIQVFDSAVPFAWLYLFPRTSDEELLLAVSVLEGNRVLLLQIRCYAEPLYIRELFEYMAAGVQVHTDPRRAEGIKLTKQLADQYYQDWQEELKDQPMAFLIRTANGTPIGYAKISAVEPNSSDSLQTELRYEEFYSNSSGASRTANQFLAADDLSEYAWTSAHGIRRKADRTTLRFQNDGSLEIRDSFGRQETCWPAPGAVPEILLPLLTRLMPDASESDALIDIISSTGSIVPTVVSKMNPLTVSRKEESTRYAVKVDFLHEPANYEEYYFDQKMNLLGKYENYPSQTPRLWERTTEKDLMAHFGNLPETQENSAK